MIAQLTIYIWLAFEVGLLVRDRIRGQGRSARDQGTLWLNFIILAVAVTAAGLFTGALKSDSAWQFGNLELAATGLILMWTGLVIRIWAIIVLGRSFRMTVEVDAGQRLTDRGPYRWVRHPSYSGILLLLGGLGLAYGNWAALAILLVLPRRADPPDLRRGGRAHRGDGPPVLDYIVHTKRLLPGLWSLDPTPLPTQT